MRTRRSAHLVVVLGTAGALTLAACGGGGGSLTQAGNESTTVAPTSSLAPGETTTTPAPSTTVATPLDDLPACPVDALPASGTVELTFWHGMTGDNEKALKKLTKAYNESQSTVKVVLQNQGGYEQAIDKYLQSSTGGRPGLVQAPEYAVRVFRDTDSFIPDRRVHRGSVVRHEHPVAHGARRLRHRGRAVVDAVQHERTDPLLQP